MNDSTYTPSDKTARLTSRTFCSDSTVSFTVACGRCKANSIWMLVHHYLWIIDLREWNYGLISSRKWGRVSRWEPTLCHVWTFLASLCGLSRGLYARAVVPYDWSGAVGLAKPFCRTIWKKAQIPVAISQNKLPALQRHHCQQKGS